jgi:hypothetical protein
MQIPMELLKLIWEDDEGIKESFVEAVKGVTLGFPTIMYAIFLACYSKVQYFHWYLS